MKTWEDMGGQHLVEGTFCRRTRGTLLHLLNPAVKHIKIQLVQRHDLCYSRSSIRCDGRPADGLSQLLSPAVGVVLKPQALDERMSCRDEKVWIKSHLLGSTSLQRNVCVCVICYPELLWARTGV